MGVAVPDGRVADLERLVRACVARDRPGAAPDNLPIIVLWGSRGSQRSQLLEHLWVTSNWPGPRAFLDGERLPTGMRPYLVANRLAFELGQKVARFGRVPFPRFFLGMWAVRNPLDGDMAAGARDARRVFINRKLRNRPEGWRWVREAAEAAARLAGWDEATSAVGLAVDGVVELSRTLALLRGPGMRWYHHGLGRDFADPVEALVRLTIHEYDEDRRFVDRVLCRAFVADLRAAYDARFTLYARKTNSAVLLDNVGTRALSRFLTLLSEQPAGSGPLLVVAASHQRYPPAAAQSPATWQPDSLGEASIDRWRKQPVRNGSRFYPVWVDAVDDVPPTAEPDRDEVRVIAGEDLGPALYPTLAFAHRLTAAHPTGLDMVLDALRDSNGRLVPGRDLRRALGPKDPEKHPEGRGLDDRVLDLVLCPWTEDMRRGLVLMAVAIDLSDAKIAPILQGEDAQGKQQIIDFRARDLWVTHQVTDGVLQPPRLHPFARRAIAHRLARPGGIASLDLRWDQAHELLRDYAAAGADKAVASEDEEAKMDASYPVLYHTLALGRLPEVATQLNELFNPVRPQRWYELLLRVTQAPLNLNHPEYAESTRAHFGKLVTHNAPELLVTNNATEPSVSPRLLAALQLHTDPLADPQHDMCGVVEAELVALAQHAGEGAAFLIEQSTTFHQCWNRWHPRGGDHD